MTSRRKKKIAIVANGISLRKEILYRSFLPLISSHHQVEVFETLSKNNGIALSRKAADSHKYDAIIAAGGDGTLHQVVNGVMEALENEPRLPAIGLIPMGSGNDFAKTAGITTDPHQLLSLLGEFKPKGVDLGEIHYTDMTGNKGKRYFVNVADIGMGPEVVTRVLDSSRVFGSSVAYYTSIIQTFLNFRPPAIRASTPQWTWNGSIRSLAVANGKFYGHGLCIAPDAKTDDSQYTVFVCENVSVLDFIRHSGTMKKGGFINRPDVHYFHANSVELSSDDPCLIEGDGEVLGQLPAKIQMIERRVPMLI